MENPRRELPAVVPASALGPWPGTDPVEAAKVSLGLFTSPHVPVLVGLPARGVGSDAVGRSAAMLVELPVDVQPYGWRFVDRAGQDLRRAASALSTDINVLADVAGAGGISPQELKIHVMGPISLAASIHLHYGERALRDYGARREIGQSLAAGLMVLTEKLRAAVPGALLTLQIDEPETAPALAGTIPTASGYKTLRSIPASELRNTWTGLVSAARTAGFATVAINVAPALAVRADRDSDEAQAAETAAWRRALEIALECGADAVALPLTALDASHWELLAGAIESGLQVWAGAVPARTGQLPPSYPAVVERITRPWQKLGLATSSLNQLRVTEENTLAQLTPLEARAVVRRTLDVAEALSEIHNS